MLVFYTKAKALDSKKPKSEGLDSKKPKSEGLDSKIAKAKALYSKLLKKIIYKPLITLNIYQFWRIQFIQFSDFAIS